MTAPYICFCFVVKSTAILIGREFHVLREKNNSERKESVEFPEFSFL